MMLKVQGISKIYKKGKGNFSALNEISFEGAAGEVIGILGRNGSGKSTLLKIISGLVAPTSGTVTHRGKISSLLEIGGGIHPELSGKDNYFLKGRILGISNAALLEKYDSLLSFTELGDFIEEPVKNYSNGMYMRLALGIGLTVKADIYLFDEVLSVGDMAFQQKCLSTVRSLAESGALVLIVSHNPHELEKYCNRYLWISNGELIKDGLDKDVLDKYVSESMIAQDSVQKNPVLIHEVMNVQSIHVSNGDAPNQSLENLSPIDISIEFLIHQRIQPFNLSIHVQDHQGVPIFSIGTPYDQAHSQYELPGRVIYRARIDSGFINAGYYGLSLYFYSDLHVIDLKHIVGFKVNQSKLDPNQAFFKGTIRPSIYMKRTLIEAKQN